MYSTAMAWVMSSDVDDVEIETSQAAFYTNHSTHSWRNPARQAKMNTV